MSELKQEFENWTVSHGSLILEPAAEMTCENGWFPATYHSAMTEIAWRAFANRRTQPEATKPAPIPGLPFADLATPIKEYEARKAAALASPVDALVAGDSAAMKTQLNQIGKSIGYGRAIQMLGQLWDDMLQAHYGIGARHQESMFRRTDIESIEAGLPIGRRVVYIQKRGRKGEITAWMPFDAEIPNVARIISDTPLYGRQQEPAIQAQKDGHG